MMKREETRGSESEGQGRKKQEGHSTRYLGYAPIRRGLREHLCKISSNGAKLYLWLHLAAWWKGKKRGTVETTYSIIADELGWNPKMVQRTVGELEKKDYIVVSLASNQHEATTIAIVNYDGKKHTPAVDTSVQGNTSGMDKDDHSFVHSSVHTKRNIPRDFKEIGVPKKAVESNRKEKDVRRPTSTAYSSEEGKKKLETRLARKITRENECLGEFLDSIERDLGRRYPDWWSWVSAGCKAMSYTLDESSPLVSSGFACAIHTVFRREADKKLLPGILASKVIDCCQETETLWPPDFQDHRDRLRAEERRQDKSAFDDSDTPRLKDVRPKFRIRPGPVRVPDISHPSDPY